MYRSDLNNRDKGGAIVAVTAVHVALLYALLAGWALVAWHAFRLPKE